MRTSVKFSFYKIQNLLKNNEICRENREPE